MTARAALVAALLAGSACVSARPEFKADPETLTIFVHGYKGGFLDEADGSHAWLSPGDALGRGGKTLAVDVPVAKDVPRFGPLTPAGPMTKLTVIPLLFSMDIYGSWMKFGARELPGFDVLEYDWRRDVREASALLAAKVDAARAKYGKRLKIRVIAHSMGGLVTLHYLRFGAERGGPVTWAGAREIERVAFVGVPFRGSAGIFDDLVVGTPTGRNRALLSREALFTFPSAWQLLPSSDDYFVDEAGQPIAGAPHLPDSWRTGGWGVFGTAENKADPRYLAQLADVLAAHDALYANLADTDVAPPASLRALVVVGTGRDTVGGVRVTKAGFDFDHPRLVDGDDSVPASSATPPKPLEFQRFETHADHVGLLNDDDVRAKVAAFLAD